MFFFSPPIGVSLFKIDQEVILLPKSVIDGNMTLPIKRPTRAFVALSLIRPFFILLRFSFAIYLVRNRFWHFDDPCLQARFAGGFRRRVSTTEFCLRRYSVYNWYLCRNCRRWRLSRYMFAASFASNSFSMRWRENETREAIHSFLQKPKAT